MSRTHTTTLDTAALRRGRFVHHRLEVYHVALELLRIVHEASKVIPRGYRSFADQILRAAGAAAALIGEGANRYTRGQKRQRFTEARGEAGEVAVHAEVLKTMGVLSEETTAAILTRADRVCAMLTPLIKRHTWSADSLGACRCGAGISPSGRCVRRAHIGNTQPTKAEGGAATRRAENQR